MSESERPADEMSEQGTNGAAAAADAPAPTNDAPVAKGDDPPAKASTPPAAPPTPEERLAQVEDEKAKLRDQLLRTAADFDNFRKRTRRELEDAQRRGRETAVKDLLPVFDNLERAAAVADSAPDAKSVGDGLRIVLKQFKDTLEKMGIKRVPTVGSPFDPSLHEAIQHLESPDQPAGVVMAEVQAGYSIGDYLLRAALVVVSKGPPQGGEPTLS